MLVSLSFRHFLLGIDRFSAAHFSFPGLLCHQATFDVRIHITAPSSLLLLFRLLLLWTVFLYYFSNEIGEVLGLICQTWYFVLFEAIIYEFPFC